MHAYILKDHTDTIIYYNRETKTLVRGTGYISTPTTTPVYYTNTILCIIVEGKIISLPDFKVTAERLSEESLTINLSKDGFFGAAQPHSWEIMFNREIVSGWETYSATKTFFETSFLDIARHSWVSAHDRKIHLPQNTRISNDGFYIDGLYYDRLENQTALNTLSLNCSEIVLQRGMQVDRYIRYDPLIYFVVFGSDTQVKLLQESLRSLLTIGQFKGDLCIVTDREDMRSFIPDSFSGKLHILKETAHSRIEMWRARYTVKNLHGIDRYQPILYLDTDIVCNDRIDDILLPILFSPNISVGTEDHQNIIMYPSIYSEMESVGKHFFEKDQFFPTSKYGFNSGIIGFSTIHVAAKAFACVVSMINRMIALSETTGWVDQAALNYVLHKLACVDEHSISALIGVGTGTGLGLFTNATHTPVLLHFWATHSNERLDVIHTYVNKRIHELESAVP
ncbi:hypothetical protein [Acetobacter conturbans]|uniref:Uncharacterized protein n=1 Tax=Acetobacter conturbans TaxID=1737472 RepID=A0ABX0JYM4_9PROT|nr:hypothetical protein [Acetobacter conturbans]NHN88433.1 hypothetical protein [Acetobacter conturbans]